MTPTSSIEHRRHGGMMPAPGGVAATACNCATRNGIRDALLSRAMSWMVEVHSTEGDGRACWPPI